VPAITFTFDGGLTADRANYRAFNEFWIGPTIAPLSTAILKKILAILKAIHPIAKNNSPNLETIHALLERRTL
jgi:hypothetical protein